MVQVIQNYFSCLVLIIYLNFCVLVRSLKRRLPQVTQPVNIFFCVSIDFMFYIIHITWQRLA